MNGVEFRSVLPSEMGAAVALWNRVFNVEKRFFTSLLDGGGSKDNLSYGAFVGDEIVASVHVFVRQVNDRDGTPHRVGGIGSVSTDPAYRQQGLSGRLLEMAIAGMEEAGCVWSYLGTGVNDHYARYGWRTVGAPSRVGRLLPTQPAKARRLARDEETRRAMAEVHAAWIAGQPMATVRTSRTWETAIEYRLSGEHRTVFGEFDDDRLVGYLVVDGREAERTLVEVAALPEAVARIPGLMRAAAGDFMGVERVVFELPETAETRSGFESIASDIVGREHRGTMYRPIAGRIDWPDLLALIGDPRGRHSALDNF